MNIVKKMSQRLLKKSVRRMFLDDIDIIGFGVGLDFWKLLTKINDGDFKKISIGDMVVKVYFYKRYLEVYYYKNINRKPRIGIQIYKPNEAAYVIESDGDGYTIFAGIKF